MRGIVWERSGVLLDADGTGLRDIVWARSSTEISADGTGLRARRGLIASGANLIKGEGAT